MACLDGSRQAESVVVGQIDVHEYQIRLEIVDLFQCGLAGAGLGNTQGRETQTQDTVERFAKIRVVLDN